MTLKDKVKGFFNPTDEQGRPIADTSNATYANVGAAYGSQGASGIGVLEPEAFEKRAGEVVVPASRVHTEADPGVHGGHLAGPAYTAADAPLAEATRTPYLSQTDPAVHGGQHVYTGGAQPETTYATQATEQPTMQVSHMGQEEAGLGVMEPEYHERHAHATERVPAVGGQGVSPLGGHDAQGRSGPRFMVPKSAAGEPAPVGAADIRMPKAENTGM